jgi:hypothetical protein
MGEGGASQVYAAWQANKVATIFAKLQEVSSVRASVASNEKGTQVHANGTTDEMQPRYRATHYCLAAR